MVRMECLRFSCDGNALELVRAKMFKRDIFQHMLEMTLQARHFSMDFGNECTNLSARKAGKDAR